MLRHVIFDKKPNGRPVVIPSSVSVANFEQQVKRFIEIADSSYFDGQLHISLFRTCHGGQCTLPILEAAVQELQEPTIVLDIRHERDALLPFFTYQLERHQKLDEADFHRVPPPNLPI